MQWQRWRWLWIWMGVLVAGCGQFWSSNGPPTATKESILPLFGYTLLPPSLTPGTWPGHTATPLIAADNSGLGTSPISFYLKISDPACYEIPVGSLVCLGRVYNPLDIPVDHVSVSVQLLSQEGTPLATGEVFVSRWMIPEGAAGPYRIVFDQIPADYAEATAFVHTGLAAITIEPRYAELVLQRVSGSFVIDQYQVMLSVINKNDAAVEQITVTMILTDRNGQVTGFRRMALDPSFQLEPSESLALTMKVIPQGEHTVGFDAFAEGVLVSD